jgi:hypothetical protein
MRVITTQHIRKHGYTDAATFKKQFGLSNLKCAAICEKQSAFMTANPPTQGGHRPESILKMRQNRKGKGEGVAGKYVRTQEIREKIGMGVLAAWENGGSRGVGFYTDSAKLDRRVWVRSSWEERVVRILDAHPCVVEYKIEPFHIPYMFEGYRHRYAPDFLVILEGGIVELWEIKPKEFMQKPKNQAKFKALNKFVSEHGFNSRIVTMDQIEEMERQVGIQPWQGEGGPWVRPDDPDYRPRSPSEQRGFKKRSLMRSRGEGVIP